MYLAKATFLAATICATTAVAGPLGDMEGTWQGSGWARQTPEGPKETVRCKITNSYDASTQTVLVTGRCAVPGRKLAMSGELTGSADETRITGRWSNPDGAGSARLVGVQHDDIIAFNLSVLDPGTGQNISQNVEWRVAPDSLHLRSSDRKNSSILMSDILFKR